jgi:hypothetical protein
VANPLQKSSLQNHTPLCLSLSCPADMENRLLDGLFKTGAPKKKDEICPVAPKHEAFIIFRSM